MDSSGLEFYTTQELIDELMRRKTFLGVVVHAKEDFREAEWRGEKLFQVHFNSNLNAAGACEVLTAIREHMADRLEG